MYTRTNYYRIGGGSVQLKSESSAPDSALTASSSGCGIEGGEMGKNQKVKKAELSSTY
jgi:hypothetical protein